MSDRRGVGGPLGGVLRATGKAVSGALNRPTGVISRHRPFYFMNLVDRVRGPSSLAAALEGKVVLVTGASSGIGEAAALRIGEAGGEVILVARTKEKLDALAERIGAAGGTAHVHPCDLSDSEDIERMTAAVLAEHGRADILVNNAGRSIRRSIALSYDRPHDYERTMALNYFGAVRMILAFLPGMRERGAGQIVNVSSAGVPIRTPRFSAYVASKAALDAFSECVQAEIAHDGVKITTIHMPLVRTPMIAPSAIYRSFPAISPDQAAERIEQAIVHRPNRIGTPMGNVAAIASALSPTSLDAIRGQGYRLYPDSAAAKGSEAEKGPADGDEGSASGEAFARVMGGTHW